MSDRLKPLVLALAAAAFASVALAACGGSGSTAASPSSLAAKASSDAVTFDRCMREHGIQAETSTADGATQTRIRGGTNITPQTMEAAQKACQKYMPADGAAPKLTPAEKVAHEEGALKFAKCMREHGIKVEISTAGGGVGVHIGIHAQAGTGSEGAPNPESPAFQKASDSCQSLLPHPKGAKALGVPHKLAPGGSTKPATGSPGESERSIGIGG